MMGDGGNPPKYDGCLVLVAIVIGIGLICTVMQLIGKW